MADDNDGVYESTEVITQEAVRSEVERKVQENLVFREAFQDYDATNINSGAVEVPVQEDTLSPTGTVAEGTTVSRDEEGITKVTVSVDKYMAEVAITSEAIEDSALGAVEQQMQAHSEAMATGMDQAAYDEISNFDSGAGEYTNLQASAVGDAGGTLDYSTVIDAMEAIETSGYSPDLLIVSAQSKNDLLKDSEFTRATEMGDEVVFEGQIGEVAGVPVMWSNTGDLGAGEGFMFDTDHYGVEVVRSDIESREYEEESKDQRVVQVRTRRGWKALIPEAGVKIEG